MECTNSNSTSRANSNVAASPAEGVAVVRVLAAVLERLVGANSGLAAVDPGPVTKFHALKSPSISVLHYLERIHKYASCSAECFVLALIYIDRMIQRNNFLLTELNVHRVVITGVLLAAKFFDDAYYNNAYYAKVGGVLVAEMNSLEVEFLFRINFSLHVTADVFSKYHAELMLHAVGTPVAAATITAAPALTADTYAVADHQPSHPWKPPLSDRVSMVQAQPIQQPALVANSNNPCVQITPSPPSIKVCVVPRREIWAPNHDAEIVGMGAPQYHNCPCEQMVDIPSGIPTTAVIACPHPVIYQQHPAIYNPTTAPSAYFDPSDPQAPYFPDPADHNNATVAYTPVLVDNYVNIPYSSSDNANNKMLMPCLTQQQHHHPLHPTATPYNVVNPDVINLVINNSSVIHQPSYLHASTHHNPPVVVNSRHHSDHNSTLSQHSPSCRMTGTAYH